jgi:outer membrane protein TolC
MVGPLVVSVYSLTYTAAADGIDLLLSEALERDPLVASALARADRAAAEVGLSRASLLPRLTASADYTRNQVAAEILLPGSDDPSLITPVDQVQATVELRVPLLNAPAVSATTASARCADAAVARADAEVQDALLDVVRLAWDARTAEVSVRVAGTAVAANETLLADAASRAEEGTGSALDVFRAEADVARAKEDLALAGAELRSLLRSLESRTGATAVPALSPRAPSADVDASDAPRVRAAELDAACRRAQVAGERLSYLPTIDGFAREQLTNATGFVDRVDTWAVGVSASWSLFDGGARVARIAQASASAREASAESERGAREARDALEDARDDEQAAQVGLARARARIAATEEALRSARERYAEGVGPAVDVSLAVRDDTDAALALARAEARAAVAVEARRVAAGEPLFGGAR